jgi:hypothetical protein
MELTKRMERMDRHGRKAQCVHSQSSPNVLHETTYMDLVGSFLGVNVNEVTHTKANVTQLDSDDSEEENTGMEDEPTAWL